MRILSLLLLGALLVSCNDQPQEQPGRRLLQVIKCWERYVPDAEGEQRSCDTIDIATDSTAAVTIHGDIRNRTAFAHRMETLLGVGAGGGFRQFVRDSTYCLVRQKERRVLFEGDSVNTALYTIDFCRHEKPALLGRLIVAEGYGLIANLGELGTTIIATTITKGEESIEIRDLVESIMADTTWLPKQSATVNPGEN
jgi:hypothetical protein